MKVKLWITTRRKASASLEAAMIVPLITFVLVTCIVVSFYIHDRVILQSTVCESVTKADSFYLEKDAKEAAQQVISNMSTKRLLGSGGLKGASSVGMLQASATYSAQYPFPGFAKPFLGANTGAINVSWKHLKLQPVTWIRLYRGLSKLVGIRNKETAPAEDHSADTSSLIPKETT